MCPRVTIKALTMSDKFSHQSKNNEKEIQLTNELQLILEVDKLDYSIQYSIVREIITFSLVTLT